jgi:DNA polymerase-1
MLLPDKIAFDKETTGLKALKDKVFSIQIGTGKDNYLIDLQEYDTPLIKGKQLYYEEVVPYIKDKELVGHNISFDIGFAYMKGVFPNKVRDTMIASKILHNGEMELNEAYKLVPMRHGFGQVMERELGLYYDKSEQKNIHKVRLSTAKAIQYCFNDVDRLLELEADLYSKLEKYGATETYKLNCDYLKAMVYMELCGLPISTQKWAAKSEVDKKTSLQLQANIVEYIYDRYPQFRDEQLNLFGFIKRIHPLLSSPDQMIPVFEAMGINIVDDDGKKSISEDVINKSPHEFVEMWLEYKGYEHRVTTFGNNILSKVENGHIYTNFNPIVDTCRIASRKKEINFLNFPADKITRDCFVASKGYKIIVADFSNQEAVTLADKSQNTASLKTILEGADSHCILAREVYPELRALSDDEIKKHHKDKRQIGKIANFTFAFGGTGYTAAKNLNISIEEGDRIYEAYRRINKETFDWGDTIYQEAIKTGYIESADGFKLKLPYFDDFINLQKKIKSFTQDEWSLYKNGKALSKIESGREFFSKDEIKALDFYLFNKENVSKLAKTRSKYMRLCLNNPIQATAAHETKRSMVNLFEYIKSRGHLRQCRIANCVHDEIVLECKEELVEEYKEALGRIMRDSANYYLKSGLVKMEADANVGDSWYEAK